MVLEPPVTAHTSFRGGHGARELRRLLGPTAWMVLEELCVRADSDGCVSIGVRRLAGDLGLDKDTVARALRYLRGIGLVDRSREGQYLVRAGGAVDTGMSLTADVVLGCPQNGDAKCCPAVGDSPSQLHAGRSEPTGLPPMRSTRSRLGVEGCFTGPSDQPTLFDSSPTTSST
jgi:hypothetical protein